MNYNDIKDLNRVFAVYHPNFINIGDVNGCYETILLPMHGGVASYIRPVKGWTFIDGSIGAFRWKGKCNWIEYKRMGGIFHFENPLDLPELIVEVEVRGENPWERNLLNWSSHKGTLSNKLTHSFCKPVKIN